MSWSIFATKNAEKEIKKLDKSAQKIIKKALEDHVENVDDPRKNGSMTRMNGDLNGFWRLRAGDFRLVCHLDQGAETLYILGLSHRREVYKKHEADKIRNLGRQLAAAESHSTPNP